MDALGQFAEGAEEAETAFELGAAFPAPVAGQINSCCQQDGGNESQAGAFGQAGQQFNQGAYKGGARYGHDPGGYDVPDYFPVDGRTAGGRTSPENGAADGVRGGDRKTEMGGD